MIGIGLVIFIHESGHYLAARWCGVRVQVFSLGFGPRLFGFRRGGTLYQIAAIPVGGFVTMAGELPDGRGRTPAPDELPAKTVGQRFLVYSGGVLSNMLSALIVFPLLFWHGVPFVKPVAGDPSPGGPAWQAGIPPGSEILEVNGAEVFDGFHIMTEVAISGGEQAELLIRDADTGESRRVRVESRYDELNGIRRIDLGLPAADPEHRIDVEEGSAAWIAGLRNGDRLVQVGDAPPEFRIMDQLLMAKERSATLELEVESSAGERRAVVLEPSLDAERTRARLGILPARAEVVGLRDGGPLAQIDLREGDRLIAVDSHRIVRTGDLELGLLAAGPDSVLVLERPAGEDVGSEGFERLQLPLPALTREQVFRVERFVALALDVEGLFLAVAPDEGGFVGGLRDGDRLLAIDGEAMLEWTAVRAAVAEATEAERAMQVVVERREPLAMAPPERLELTAEAIPQPERNIGSRFDEYGFAPRTWDYTFRADGPVDAIRVGLATSWLYVKQTWLTLKGMLLSQVSTRNIGGPVAIGQISYSFAENGWPKLLYFLCMLSVNLALINLLPVPVLDGGHLLFLVVEKVKGSPVSERVVGYSQLVGVVFIVGLMVYVTFNDVRRVLGL